MQKYSQRSRGWEVKVFLLKTDCPIKRSLSWSSGQIFWVLSWSPVIQYERREKVAEKGASSADTCPFAHPLVTLHSFKRGPSISTAFLTTGIRHKVQEGRLPRTAVSDISLHGGTMWCNRRLYVVVARKQWIWDSGGAQGRHSPIGPPTGDLPPWARDSLPRFPAPSPKQHYQLGPMLPSGEPLERMLHIWTRISSRLESSRVNPKATLEVFILDPKGKHSKMCYPNRPPFPYILGFSGS